MSEQHHSHVHSKMGEHDHVHEGDHEHVTGEARLYDNEYVEGLTENLKWCTAVLSVILEQEGGAIELNRADVSGVDLNTARIQVRFKDEDTLIVEGMYDEPNV